MKKKAFKAAFPYTIPIGIGFLFLGMSYGFMMQSKGFSVWYPFFMSMFIFAGSMEFVTSNLLLSAFSPVAAFFLALMVNARHLFYGLSMLDKYKNTGWKKFYLIFGMCDESFTVNCTVTPPDDVEKGDYSIPVTAISSEDNLSEDLSVSITGTYDVSLSTPDGRLSLDAYADKESTVTLSVTNNGNVDLTNLNLTSSAPTDWEVTFSESTIDTLEAGATKEITATIKPAQDVITGDYVTSISIKNDEASSSADLRVSVKTSTTWGIAAIAIIVVLVAVLGMIFKKFGRR